MRCGSYFATSPACSLLATRIPVASGAIGLCEYLNLWSSGSTGNYHYLNNSSLGTIRASYVDTLPTAPKAVRTQERRTRLPEVPLSGLGGRPPQWRGHQQIAE